MKLKRFIDLFINGFHQCGRRAGQTAGSSAYNARREMWKKCKWRFMIIDLSIFQFFKTILLLYGRRAVEYNNKLLLININFDLFNIIRRMSLIFVGGFFWIVCLFFFFVRNSGHWHTKLQPIHPVIYNLLVIFLFQYIQRGRRKKKSHQIKLLAHLVTIFSKAIYVLLYKMNKFVYSRKYLFTWKQNNNLNREPKKKTLFHPHIFGSPPYTAHKPNQTDNQFFFLSVFIQLTNFNLDYGVYLLSWFFSLV